MSDLVTPRQLGNPMPELRTWHEDMARAAPCSWAALSAWFALDWLRLVIVQHGERRISMMHEDVFGILRAAGWKSPQEVAALEAQTCLLTELRELRQAFKRGLFGGLDDFALQVLRVLDVGGTHAAPPSP